MSLGMCRSDRAWCRLSEDDSEEVNPKRGVCWPRRCADVGDDRCAVP